MNRCRADPLRLLALAALALLAMPALAGGSALPDPLAPFTAKYRVTNGTLRLGTTTISLLAHGPGWRYRSVTQADGLFRLFVSGKAIESTDLIAHGDWLRPTRYLHEEPEEEDNVRVDFDWSKDRATAHDDKGKRRLDLDSKTVDEFSATLSLVRALANGQDEIHLSTIDDKGKKEELRFRRAARERIDVPYGAFDTVRVDRIHDDSDRQTITWLAPELAWVAVRIEQHKDGDLVGRLELIDLDGPAADGAD